MDDALSEDIERSAEEDVVSIDPVTLVTNSIASATKVQCTTAATCKGSSTTYGQEL